MAIKHPISGPPSIRFVPTSAGGGIGDKLQENYDTVTLDLDGAGGTQATIDINGKSVNRFVLTGSGNNTLVNLRNLLGPFDLSGYGGTNNNLSLTNVAFPDEVFVAPSGLDGLYVTGNVTAPGSTLRLQFDANSVPSQISLFGLSDPGLVKGIDGSLTTFTNSNQYVVFDFSNCQLPTTDVDKVLAFVVSQLGNMSGLNLNLGGGCASPTLDVPGTAPTVVMNLPPVANLAQSGTANYVSIVSHWGVWFNVDNACTAPSLDGQIMLEIPVTSSWDAATFSNQVLNYFNTNFASYGFSASYDSEFNQLTVNVGSYSDTYGPSYNDNEAISTTTIPGNSPGIAAVNTILAAFPSATVITN